MLAARGFCLHKMYKQCGAVNWKYLPFLVLHYLVLRLRKMGNIDHSSGDSSTTALAVDNPRICAVCVYLLDCSQASMTEL
jgi:hypothetical protein